MSEFKVGDRITGAEYNGRTHTGVVVRVGPNGLTGVNEYLIRPDGGGDSRYVRKDTAVAAEPEVRKGDKVRVTVEGEVTYVYDRAQRDIHVDGAYVAVPPAAKVEVLERAKPALEAGDVVLTKPGLVYLVGRTNLHVTHSPGGDVTEALNTKAELAQRIADHPDRCTHIKYADLKGFKA